MAQVKYSFDKESLIKIGKGALIALGGCLLTYLAEQLPFVDFGSYTPVAVSVFSFLINAGKEWIKGQ